MRKGDSYSGASLKRAACYQEKNIRNSQKNEYAAQMRRMMKVKENYLQKRNNIGFFKSNTRVIYYLAAYIC